jgi:hypothetical protein
MSVDLTLASVLSLHQQLQYVQISRDRAQRVVNQLTTNGELSDTVSRLVVAIKFLKNAEADLMSELGFTQAADALRGSL